AVLPLVILKLVNYSLEYGYTKDSCVGYAAYGFILTSLRGDPRTAYECSKLGVALNQKLGDTSRRGSVLEMHGNHINYWVNPIATNFAMGERGLVGWMDGGDLVYAGYIAAEFPWQAVERGDTIDDALAFSGKYAAVARDSRNEAVLHTIRVEQQFLACLKGAT